MTSTRQFLGTVVLSLVSLQVAHASLVTFVSAQVDAGVNAGVQDTHFDIGSSLLSTSAALSGGFDSSSYILSSSAEANFGVLKTFASAALTNYAPVSYNSSNCDEPYDFCGPAGGSSGGLLPAQAFASFTDSLKVTGGSGTAYLVLTLLIEGNISTLSDDLLVDFNTRPQISVTARAGGVFKGSTASNLVGANNFTFRSNPIAVTFGVAQDVTLESWTTVDLIDAVASGNYNYTGTANFGSTVTLSSVGLYTDSLATRPYGSFGLLTESGKEYDTNSSLAGVPEPSSMLLFAGAFAALVVGRRVVKTR